MLETEPKLVSEFVKAGKLKLVFSHIVDYGAPSSLASQAAECAGDQGKFWPMHHLLFERQSQVWSAQPELFVGWAKQDLKLDEGAFRTCLTSGKYKSKVEDQHNAAKSSGVRIRPTFDINGRRVQGAVTFDALQKIISEIR